MGGLWLLQTTVPRQIVFASGPVDGLSHRHAQRYAQLLARNGITVHVRTTEGAEENERLLQDPRSNVDVAIIPGGVIAPDERGTLVMLAALYYQPLWVFYRGPEPVAHLSDLRGKRIAIGSPSSTVRSFVTPLLEANAVSVENSNFDPRSNLAALAALQGGEVDAMLLLGSVEAPAVWQALHDPKLVLASLDDAGAYPRRFAHIAKLTLPPGTVDFGHRIPPRDVNLIGTKAMLVARDDLSPTIVHILVDAARELHMRQSHFEALGEFPNVMPVDLAVSQDAARHLRYGPTMFERRLPPVLATYAERLLIVLLPLALVLIPFFNLLPNLYGAFVRSRIHRWYGELKLLEHDIDMHMGPPPMAQWLGNLDRIERAAAAIKVPKRFASEAFTLREHIGLVRRAAVKKAAETQTGAASIPGV